MGGAFAKIQDLGGACGEVSDGAGENHLNQGPGGKLSAGGAGGRPAGAGLVGNFLGERLRQL